MKTTFTIIVSILISWTGVKAQYFSDSIVIPSGNRSFTSCFATNNYLFVSDATNDSIYVIDISTQSIIASKKAHANAGTIKYSNGKIFLGNDAYSVEMYDASNIYNITYQQTLSGFNQGSLWSDKDDNTYFFWLEHFAQKIRIVDFSTGTMVVKSNPSTGGNVQGASRIGNSLFVANAYQTSKKFNIANPISPIITNFGTPSVYTKTSNKYIVTDNFFNGHVICIWDTLGNQVATKTPAVVIPFLTKDNYLVLGENLNSSNVPSTFKLYYIANGTFEFLAVSPRIIYDYNDNYFITWLPSKLILYSRNPCTTPPTPVANNVSICGAGTATLIASGGTNYNWYNTPTGGSTIGTGATFNTPYLTVSDTFWVSNFVNCESARAPVLVTVLNQISTITEVQLSTMPITGVYPITTSTTINGKIFMFGLQMPPYGQYTPYNASNAIRTYDLATNSWAELPFQLPYGIFGGEKASFYNNHFYLGPEMATGNSNGFGSHKKMIDVNLSTNTAVETTQQFSTSSIWNISSIQANGKIYFFGGYYYPNPINKIFEYNPSTGLLNQVASFINARHDVTSVSGNDGWIYCLGAWTNKIERFNPLTLQVEVKPDTLPTSDRPHNFWHVTSENSIYYFSSGVVNPVIYKYNYSTGVISNTGITLAGTYINKSIMDSTDQYSIYCFKTNPDQNSPSLLVKITLNSCNPIVPPPMAASVTLCEPGTATLTASGGTNYNWYNTATGGSIIGTGATFMTPYLTVSDTFWVTNFTTIESIRVPVVVTINTAHIAQNDTTICAGSSITLNITGASAPVSSNGLVGYWPFNGNANDESGNGHDGNVNGAALTTDRFGNTDKAYSFDGVNDFIETNNSPSMNYPQGFSICTWVNSNALNADLSIISKHLPGFNNGFVLGALLNNFRFWINGHVISTSNFNDGNWHNIIGIYDGLMKAIYIDGIFIQSQSSGYLSNSYPIVFGEDYGGGYFFNGEIDDIRIYDRALTQSEITALYNENSPTTSYFWSTGDTTAAITVTPTQSTTYYVTITNGSSYCIDSVLVSVNPSNLTLNLSDVINAPCGSNNVVLDAGTGFSVYSWSNGATTQAITVTQSGLYKVTVTGCVNGSNVDSTQVNLITANIAQNDTTVNTGSTLTLNIQGAVTPTPSPTNGLIAYYPFNGNANDESGNGHNGTVFGSSLASDRFGYADKAYSFNGSDNYIDIGDWAMGGEMSLCGWIKHNSYNHMSRFFNFSNGQYVDPIIVANGDDNSCYLSNDCFPTTYVPNYYSTNNWTFVALTYSLADNFKLYRDGLLYYSDSLYSLNPNTIRNNQYFGKSDFSIDGYFNGYMDDIRIYDRALNPSEITALYNEGSASSNYTYLWSTGATTPSISVTPAQTTTYYVTITQGGASCIDSVKVTVNQPIVTTTIAPDINTCPGTVTVPITVENLSGVAAISLSLQYNSSILTYTGYQNVNPALASGLLNVNAINQHVNIGWFSITPVTFTNASLVDLQFSAVVGSSPLTWNTITPGACQYTDIDNVILTSNYVNGSVTVITCSHIEGIVSYDNTVNTPMNNTVVLLKHNGVTVNQDTTDAGGHFLFENLNNGTYTLAGATTKPWGGVNSADGLLILKHFTGMIPLTGMRLIAADLDGGGYVNASDALLAAKRFVGITNSFSVGDWIFEKDTVVITGLANVTDNFKALCYGDVNGSYTPAAKTEPTLTLENDGIIDVAGLSEVSIPIKVKDNVEVGSMSLALEIPSCLRVTNIVPSAEGNIVFKQDGNSLRIAWFSLQPMLLKAGDILMTLKANYDNSGVSACDMWSVDPVSQVTDGNAVPYDQVGLILPKLQYTNNEFTLGQNIPNPFTDVTEIPYYLPESGKVTLKIFDVVGNEVKTLVDQSMAAGAYTAKFEVGIMSSGIYSYQISIIGSTKYYTKTRLMVIGK